MSRAVWLVVAVLLVLPPLSYAWTAVTSTAFLIEFLSGGRWRPLTSITRAPEVQPLAASAAGRPIPVDLYATPSLDRPSGLVLVHGITGLGKDDPQLRAAATLLARAGWAVAVPTVEGLTVLRLRPEDAGSVAAATRALDAQGYRPVALLAISLGSAPTLAAAGEPDVAGRLSAVLALGGYASARELLRYTLTGAYAFEGARGRRPVEEGGIARFAEANVELVESGGRALVDNRDPDRVDGLIAALPGNTQRLLDALSPERTVARLRAPLYLVHGRGDRTVPFTESLRLTRAATAAGRPVRTVIIGSVGHVDPEARATPVELLRSWAVFYAFRVNSATVSR